jgi:lipopolysaccharide transport system ATP-binding protein
MSSDDVVIGVRSLSKHYQIYDRPGDRLKQFILPRVRRALGLGSRDHFREFRALDSVDFLVRRGETVGIIGRNGSGKSTLLQLICGTLNPTSGSIEVRGKVAALLELGSGFNPEFTGRENVFMNAALLGLTTEQTAERFDRITAFADIGEHIDQPVKTYSSGMLVRLAFAVIAHVDADILVIDEALAVGDAFFTQKCMRFLRAFMETGTVLFVSHDTAAVRGLCNRAIWLDKGRLVAEGPPKEVSERYIEAFYEAQQGTVAAPKRREARKPGASAPWKDQRAALVNQSTLRNDLRIFEFDAEGAAFGRGDALIRDVRLVDAEGEGLSWVVGGEPVTLRILAEAVRPVAMPIVGFYLKDQRGQTLFGDNTFLKYRDSDLRFEAGELFRTEFSFTMPVLPHGPYSIAVAVATGTAHEHVQHHWIHDALLIKSESTSVSTGLVGIPMDDITLGGLSANEA